MAVSAAASHHGRGVQARDPALGPRCGVRELCPPPVVRHVPAARRFSNITASPNIYAEERML